MSKKTCTGIHVIHPVIPSLLKVRKEYGSGWFEAPVKVVQGTGLGYMHYGGNERSPYVLLHLRSGLCLIADGVETEAAAQRWLSLVAPLAEWSQAEQELVKASHLGQMIRAMRAVAEGAR
jgi:hypothetical protein